MTPSPPAATPRLAQLYCYLTAGCNLRCRHCYLAPAWEPGAELVQPCLDVGLFADVVRQGKELGLTAVKLTGGEPLLHPRFADIVAVAREHELRLIVETNGVLCT
ncbi:MAG: radical SAM protein, partial [Actinomycetes bacterium]